MRFLTDNMVVIQVALVCSALAWVFGGTRGDILLQMAPWLWVMLLEGMLCFPQRHENETTTQARTRVWKSMKRDKLTWVTVGFLVLLCIPFVNNALCPLCDFELIEQGHSAAPKIPFAPFCVNRMHHLNVFQWFALALTSMIAVRHSMLKRGKRLLLELLVWNGVALTAMGFIQQIWGAPGPLWAEMPGGGEPGYFFSTFGYPNMAGDLFTSLFLLAIALWRRRYDDVCEFEHEERASGKQLPKYKLFWAKHYLLIAAFVNFFAAMNTLSRASIILVSAGAVIMFFHTEISFLAKMKKADRVRAGALSCMVLVIIALAAVIFTPDDFRKEIDTLSGDAVLQRVTGKGQYHAKIATMLWKKHWAFGCGGWGYKHLCIPMMTEDEYKHLQVVGGINVHNDYLQFMAEHGSVGFGCLVAIVVMLLVPVGKAWKELANAVRFVKKRDQPPPPQALFAMPGSVFAVLVAVLATLVHAFGDCPLRSPAVLTLFFVELAAIVGFLPRIEKKD